MALISFWGAIIHPLPASAQDADERQPIDMMVVIDNSCSMFPGTRIIPGCEVWGSDPDFLRITGADLFLARLGFAEEDADNYQAGVISMGERARLVSELRPLAESRDTLARAIVDPTPELATQLVPSLNLAYEELQSSRRRPENLPAIVLLTDGRPYPEEGQSEADIENTIAAHPDIPLFLILLQDPSNQTEGFERYINFWERLSRTYDHVRTYRVRDAEAIEQTYNEIVSRLQNTIPGKAGTSLPAGETLNAYVGQCVQRLIVTIIHDVSGPRSTVKITDPLGDEVTGDEEDVQRFRGTDNPVEVISIGAERLDVARDDVWTIQADAPVRVFLDRAGCYSIDFVEPAVSNTTVPNQFLAINRQSPAQSLDIRFRLIGNDDERSIILTPQSPIVGVITNPDGSKTELRIPASLAPNADGVYQITHDLASTYPAVRDQAGRFAITLEVGESDEPGSTGERRLPIARADLLVDVGRGAYIVDVSPNPLVCRAGQPAPVTVTAGDLETARPGSVFVRVIRPTGTVRQVELSGSGDTFSGSLEAMCQELLAGLDCDQSVTDSVRVRLAAENVDGTSPTPSERVVAVEAQAAACPTATPAPTPTPTPTPIPDTDADGKNDLVDRCPQTPEWSVLRQFNGCPPPWWLIIVMALTGLALLAFLVLFVIPWLLVMTFRPPPDGYVLVCVDGRAQGGGAKSIRGIGTGVRRSKVTIGNKGHIRVSGLPEVAYWIERRGKEAVIVDAKSKIDRFTIGPVPKQIRTDRAVLHFCTENAKLRSCS